MTPSEMLERYAETHNADFLNELEGDDLWAFLMAGEIFTMKTPVSFADEYHFRALVAAEAQREYAADADIWTDKLLDRDIFRDEIAEHWITELDQIYENGKEPKMRYIRQMSEFFKRWSRK